MSSDSDDDQPLTFRRNREQDGPPNNSGAKPPAATANGVTGPTVAAAVLAPPAPPAAPVAAPPRPAPAPVAPKPEPISPDKKVAQPATGAAAGTQPAAKEAAAVKQEDSDDEDLPLAARKAVAPAPAKNSSAAAAPTKPKKELLSDSDDEDKPIGARQKKAAPASKSAKLPAAAKPPKQAAAAANGRGAQGKSEATEKSATVRVKKEYDLPGQTRDTPLETDSLRRFYTSLLEENPDSAMAQRWCVQHGLLSAEAAQRWLAANKGGVKASPMKANGASSSSRSAGVKRPAPKAVAKLPPKAPHARKQNRKQRVFADASSEEEEDDDSSEDQIPLVQRKAAARK